MYRLFLDDIRVPCDIYKMTKNSVYLEDWEIVSNYTEFTEYITIHGVPSLVSFDHDLSDIHYVMNTGKTIDYSLYEEKTGYSCASWLINYCIDNKVKLPAYLVHSMNPVGATNIRYLMENYKRYMKK
jgi:hypothetical protein